MVNFVNEDLISYYYLDLAQIVGWFLWKMLRWAWRMFWKMEEGGGMGWDKLMGWGWCYIFAFSRID